MSNIDTTVPDETIQAVTARLSAATEKPWLIRGDDIEAILAEVRRLAGERDHLRAALEYARQPILVALEGEHDRLTCCECRRVEGPPFAEGDRCPMAMHPDHGATAPAVTEAAATCNVCMGSGWASGGSDGQLWPGEPPAGCDACLGTGTIRHEDTGAEVRRLTMERDEARAALATARLDGARAMLREVEARAEGVAERHEGLAKAARAKDDRNRATAKQAAAEAVFGAIREIRAIDPAAVVGSGS